MEKIKQVVHLEMDQQDLEDYMNLRTDADRINFNKKLLDKMLFNNPKLEEEMLNEAKQKSILNKKLKKIANKFEKAKIAYLEEVESLIGEMLPQEVSVGEFLKYGKDWERVSLLNLDHDDLVEIGLYETRLAEIVIENFEEILEMFQDNNL